MSHAPQVPQQATEGCHVDGRPFAMWAQARVMDENCKAVALRLGVDGSGLRKWIERGMAGEQLVRAHIEDALARADVAMWEVYSWECLDPGRIFDRYCPKCKEQVTVGEDGVCPWCETTTRQKRPREGRKGYLLRKDSRLTEEQVRAAHRIHIREFRSLRSIGGDWYEELGFKNKESCAMALSNAMQRLGLERRNQADATADANRRRRDPDAPERGTTPTPTAEYRRYHKRKKGRLRRCRGIRKWAPRQGERCGNYAQSGQDYCWAHDPANADYIETHLALSRARRPKVVMLPFAPFGCWVRRLHRRHGTLRDVAGILGCSVASVANFEREVSTRDGVRQRRTEISRARLEHYLTEARDGTDDVPTVGELYGDLV